MHAPAAYYETVHMCAGTFEQPTSRDSIFDCAMRRGGEVQVSITATALTCNVLTAAPFCGSRCHLRWDFLLPCTNLPPVLLSTPVLCFNFGRCAVLVPVNPAAALVGLGCEAALGGPVELLAPGSLCHADAFVAGACDVCPTVLPASNAAA
jgi:hypothetical protein